MSHHPTLDAAIKRGEIQQCQHCQIYWVASCYHHECPQMLRVERDRLAARVKELEHKYEALHSQVSGYLHGEDWEHWQKFNAPRHVLDTSRMPV